MLACWKSASQSVAGSMFEGRPLPRPARGGRYPRLRACLAELLHRLGALLCGAAMIGMAHAGRYGQGSREIQKRPILETPEVAARNAILAPQRPLTKPLLGTSAPAEGSRPNTINASKPVG